MNSGSANCEQLVKVDTNFAWLSPADAERIDVSDNDRSQRMTFERIDNIAW